MVQSHSNQDTAYLAALSTLLWWASSLNTFTFLLISGTAPSAFSSCHIQWSCFPNFETCSQQIALHMLQVVFTISLPVNWEVSPNVSFTLASCWTAGKKHIGEQLLVGRWRLCFYLKLLQFVSARLSWLSMALEKFPCCKDFRPLQ